MRFLFILCLFPALLVAQPTAERTCRILFLDAPDEAPSKLIHFDGTTAQEVDLPRMNLSRIYTLPAGAIRLRMLSTRPADASAIPAGAPAVEVPEATGDIYLILAHDSANTVAPVRMQIVNAAANRLGPGQMLWINLTPNAVGGLVGSEKLNMAAQSCVILNAPASGPTDYEVRLACRIPGEANSRPICQTKWLHDPRSRMLVFVIGDQAKRSPRVMAFPDYREPKQSPSVTAVGR